MTSNNSQKNDLIQIVKMGMAELVD